MYFIVSRHKKRGIEYSLSISRNAIKILNEKEALGIEVYDCNGWLLSKAELDDKGVPFRTELFLDGEPRKYYKAEYKKLLAAKRLERKMHGKAEDNC